MSERVVVDLDGLASLVDRMAQIDEHLQRQLDVVERAITELHLDWSGTAAAAHRDTHARWVCGAEEMRDALAELRAIVKTAHENHTAANHARWSR